MKDSFGIILKNARLKKNISQQELANMLNISTQAVSKWENDISKPNADNLISLMKILDVLYDDLYITPEVKDKSDTIVMRSVKEIYKIGRGPSSSHTIGPERACIRFKKENPDADAFKIILYGSLAKTGKGHATNSVIIKTLFPTPTKIEFDVNTKIPHPNTLDMFAYKNGTVVDKVRVLSIGGGDIIYGEERTTPSRSVYDMFTFTEISEYCKNNSLTLWEYVLSKEEQDFFEYLRNVWDFMKASIHKGLHDEGILPGGLNVQKKAKSLFTAQHIDESAETKENRLICAYAFAVSEQNASGETIVTSPTCGAAGVLPAVLYYEQKKHNFPDKKIIKALATAGLIGNLIKTNASISGAECGCQAEIGSACAMAAAALAQLFDLSIDKIEYAAEIALEHHLGLTCDPICGLVQIPCIERNAVAAMRAINAVNLASFLWNTRKISFDNIVKTMKETGRDLSPYLQRNL